MAGEITMHIRVKNQSHFLNLMEDPILATIYFHNKNINEFNNQRLIELQNDYKKAKAKYNKKLFLLSITSFLGLDTKTYNLSKKVEQEHKKVINCLNKIDIFDSNLSYLFISGIINLEKSKQLGFSSDYIKNLLEQYKKQVENPYIEYYYNENSGTTSMQTENGKSLILPYTPHEIGNKIKEKRAKVPVIGNKSTPRYRFY